jgi:hypothetical protein
MSLDGVIREVYSHEDVKVIRISLERDGARSNGTLIISAEEAGPYKVGAHFHCHTDQDAPLNVRSSAVVRP